MLERELDEVVVEDLLIRGVSVVVALVVLVAVVEAETEDDPVEVGEGVELGDPDTVLIGLVPTVLVNKADEVDDLVRQAEPEPVDVTLNDLVIYAEVDLNDDAVSLALICDVTVDIVLKVIVAVCTADKDKKEV
jgi:hypothetical protein